MGLAWTALLSVFLCTAEDARASPSLPGLIGVELLGQCADDKWSPTGRSPEWLYQCPLASAVFENSGCSTAILFWEVMFYFDTIPSLETSCKISAGASVHPSPGASARLLWGLPLSLPLSSSRLSVYLSAHIYT